MRKPIQYLVVTIALTVALSSCDSAVSPEEGVEYAPMPDLSRFSGEWQLKASKINDYHCDSDECHWYVQTDTGAVAVRGVAVVLEGPAWIGEPEIVSVDTIAKTGVILSVARASLGVEVSRRRRCSRATSGILVACADLESTFGPGADAFVSIVVHRAPDLAEAEVAIDVNYTGDNVIDGTLESLAGDWDIWVSDEAALSDLVPGWVLRR